jgi:hypothetical protein
MTRLDTPIALGERRDSAVATATNTAEMTGGDIRVHPSNYAKRKTNNA